jgi:predicted transport protein
MALGGETNSALKPLFKDLIQDLNYSVAYPLLLELYADYSAGVLSVEDFATAIKLVESYVFRRSICEIPTNSMNKTFAEFSRYLVKDDYLNSIYAHFYSLPNYRRFPSNEEFRLAFQTKDLYNISSRGYWLRKMENFGKKESVAVENYTIEHILPQNPNLSVEWKNDLGENWEEIQFKYLHTLGNLTLTGYNSEYSDKPFKVKKCMDGGFAKSPLMLNEMVRDVEVWNESAILNRATFLSQRAIAIWPRFEVDAGTLKKFETVKSEASNYTLEDHPNLERQEVRALFDALRTEVLALDSSISETVLKYYIAYKAETNFVDVIPKAHGLRLSLNMKFSELDDPLGMATDITDKGRWGNGDVSINFKKIEELPYVIGLIKQSLAKQLGNS